MRARQSPASKAVNRDRTGGTHPRVSRRLILSAALASIFSLPALAEQDRGTWGLFARSPGSGSRRRVPTSLGPSTRTAIAYASEEAPGTILIDTVQRTLYLVTASDRALAYRVGVGRDGFGWTGRVTIGAKAKWPTWRPPEAMKEREPKLPDLVPAGPLNPLGARALYLYRGGADTLYRIHGTNSADTIGGNVSSGCFRLTNTDVIDLYDRVRVGARVIVY